MQSRCARRRALCIGVDQYTRAPLQGAVSDAERFANVLAHRDFEITLLRNGEATRPRVLEELRSLIGQARRGERIALTYAGHGTRDLGRSDDTAIVLADAEDGGIVLDDEIGEVMADIRPGVMVTLFFDCCHSGTMSRSLPAQMVLARSTLKARHLSTDPHIREAFTRLRQVRRMKWGQSLAARLLMREVCIAACGDHEVAYEVEGAGVFTAAATALLEESGSGGWSNQGFVGALEVRMGRVLGSDRG